MYKIRAVSPLHPKDPAELGPFRERAQACSYADGIVHEYMSVLVRTDDDVARVLLAYVEQAEQPTVLDVSSEAPIYVPDLEAIAFAWVHGSARTTHLPPED